MIITCPNCNKQFKIDNSLIPDEGRDLQCGSCNHIWFYNIQEKNNNEALELKQEIISENIESKAENNEAKIAMAATIKVPCTVSLDVGQETLKASFLTS